MMGKAALEEQGEKRKGGKSDELLPRTTPSCSNSRLRAEASAPDKRHKQVRKLEGAAPRLQETRTGPAWGCLRVRKAPDAESGLLTTPDAASRTIGDCSGGQAPGGGWRPRAVAAQPTLLLIVIGMARKVAGSRRSAKRQRSSTDGVFGGDQLGAAPAAG